ncbi:MAG: hypothetical protein ABH824_07095 [Nanoarchaeota archaeon]
MFKKGKLAWEYIVVIILALMVLVVMLSFSTFVRDKAIEAFGNLWNIFLRR